MRLLFTLIILFACFTLSLCVGFTFLTTARIVLNQSYRDIRLTSYDPISGIHQGCITDSITAVEFTQITVNASNGSVEIIPKNADAFNIGGSYYNSATGVQGSSSPCAIGGIITINGQQYVTNVQNEQLICEGPEIVSARPTYSIATDNGIMTIYRLQSTTVVTSVYNCSVPGPLNYTMDNDLEITKYGATRGTSNIFWVYIWQEPSNNYMVMKCLGTGCNNETILVADTNDLMLTARGDEWYGCGKSGSDWYCTSSAALGIKTLLPANIAVESPTNQSTYSVCQPDSDTLVLLIINQYNYTLYALDLNNDFAIINQSEPTPKPVDGFAGMDCLGEIVLVGTTNEVDVFRFDRSIIPPVSDTPINDTPVDTPSVTSAPVPSDPAASSPNRESTSDLPTDQRNIVIGVLVGVVLPVIGTAIFLAVYFSKKNKAKQRDALGGLTDLHELPLHPGADSQNQTTNNTYLMMPEKGDEEIDAKLVIPYKSLSFMKEIGAGSFGKVYLGKWRGAVVAIKTNNRSDDYDAFLREARLTLQMPPHPNVVLTYGVSTDGNEPCIILEYCDGGGLDKLIFNQTLNHIEQRALVKGIAQGLAHLHQHNIVHRDLAARNVLLNKGTPKISDFGMSRVLNDSAQQGKTNSNVGPIRWMAPESLKHMLYSIKSDVWTFGIVISEIVNRSEPHVGENQIGIAFDIRDKGYTPSLPSDCDPLLKELMQMCCKMNPDERPTMDEICEYISEKF